MIAWITGNLGTILVALVLLLILAAIVWGMVRNKRKGRSSACSCKCGGCPMSGSCHSAKQ